MDHLCIVCACFSDEHTLHFDYDEEYGDLVVSVHLRTYRNIFKRIWVAIKYVFGYRCKYGEWDETIIRWEDIPKLQKLLEKRYNTNSKFVQETIDKLEKDSNE